jgi:heavy metal sensor kinase
MILHSIRWRLQVWHGLLLVLVLAGFGLTAYHVARDNQFRRIDQELDQRFMALLRPQPPERPMEPPSEMHQGKHHGNTFESPEFTDRIRDAIQQAGAADASQTNGFYYVLWSQDGSLLASSPGTPGLVPMPAPFETSSYPANIDNPAGRRPGPPHPPVVRTRDGQRELYRFLPQGECVLIGRSMAPDLAAMRRLGLWLAAAGAGVLLLGLAGGWWLASRAIRPIEDISATAVKIAGGDLSQRINVADTDSELGHLAGVLNSTFARLEAAFAHQARFTSDASHELRTPVSVILSQAQTALSRERAAPEYREALEACQRAAQRMRRLTESLLELARLDAGQDPMKQERFDLSRVARDSVELVRPLAAERHVQLHCDLPATECLGDAERIGQVVTNLLTNAIHFNRDGGEVGVSTQTHNGTVLLTVSDTGEGIPPEDLHRIFERFYRVDKSRSRIQGRTGLGLAICKAIVDAHSGAIDVSSKPGAGSTFTVSLPQTPSPARTLPAKETPLAAGCE